MGTPGNPGSQGPPGLQGPTGPVGMPGPEGGAPSLLTNPLAREIQYGDGDNVLEIQQHGVMATEDGHLLVRLYFHGSVSKRPQGNTCRVRVGLRRDQEAVYLVHRDVGIWHGPAGERMEVSVGGTLAARLPVGAGESVLFRLEIQRADGDCVPAGAAGATRVAEIVGQLEVQFFRTPLSGV